tara:strand:- start:233 stop:391 length:159 start_codon:yes stop_codon:yes gene_type:complete
LFGLFFAALTETIVFSLLTFFSVAPRVFHGTLIDSRGFLILFLLFLSLISSM